jgi:hypothetical protein
MKSHHTIIGLVGLLSLGACGAAPATSPKDARAVEVGPAASAQAARPTKVEATAEAESSERISAPTECAAGSSPCQPSRDFVARLCAGKNASIALSMFGAETPWKRAYVRVREIDAINTAGGPPGDENLVFDEEVIVLNRRSASKTELSVSGADGYLVLRWDGTCSTVQSDEMTDRVPPKPLHAPIAFNYLSDELQSALLVDAKIRNLRRVQRDKCGGRSLAPDAACRDANRKLGDRIVAALRSGLGLAPEPRSSLASR